MPPQSSPAHTTLILDADMLAYEAVAAVQEEIEWEPYCWTFTADIEVAATIFTKATARLIEAAGATHVVLAWSSGTNFRKGLYGPYKAGRGRKPVGYWAFRQAQEAATELCGIPCSSWVREGLEGDDIIGVLMTRAANDMGTRILWSGDKDMLQIPGIRLNTPKGGTASIEVVHPDDAMLFHARQTLTGDSTDGYPGCPGMGPVSATKALSGVPLASVWAKVEACYVKAGLTRDDMLVQARVARILHATDFDFNTKAPIPWLPS